MAIAGCFTPPSIASAPPSCPTFETGNGRQQEKRNPEPLKTTRACKGQAILRLLLIAEYLREITFRAVVMLGAPLGRCSSQQWKSPSMPCQS